MSKSEWQERFRALLAPAVTLLADAGVSPAVVTLLGLALNVASGIVIGTGSARTGGALLVLAGLCDAIDGQLARRTGRVSRFGAFLDSTVDRIDETAVLAGIAAWFLRSGIEHWAFLSVAALLALAGSLITSYTRARAEGLGLDCRVGAFERPERVVVTIAGLLVGGWVLAGAILVVLFMSWFTVLQRVIHVRREAERLEGRRVATEPLGGAVSPGAPSPRGTVR